MSTYKLTLKARSDLADILLYTTDTWGEEQAERYLSLLSDGFDLIAQKPGIGRACDPLAPGLRRFERGKHVIFYKPGRGSIVISRILHQRRLPTRPHFMDA
ncbi:MAG TPA: type II toxin-antitoxin system RelE/ParE family toxin [Edaphobacter sp.]|nr:type II toxin-antitoxin system RelE/ParE family toxin [Edaphobacter sp.]